MAEGLSWALLCLRLQSSLPWHGVGWVRAASGLEGKV